MMIPAKEPRQYIPQYDRRKEYTMNKYDMRQAIVDHADSIDSTYDLMTLRNSIKDITEEDLDDAEFRDKCRTDIQDMVNGTDDATQLAEMLDLIK